MQYCVSFFLFLFLFLAGVGRLSGSDTREHYPCAVAAISKKESELNPKAKNRQSK